MNDETENSKNPNTPEQFRDVAVDINGKTYCYYIVD